MIRLIRGVALWFIGEGDCPACDSALSANEGGFYTCPSCSAVVDYERGGWAYRGESKLRRLPGISGMAYDRRAS